MNPPVEQIDELTGALSREVFEANFSTALTQAAQDKQHLSLVTTDIDSFLHINQNHGRAVGDLVLQRIVRVFQNLTPENTLVFRYGGDEFYLILPDTTREQALLTMEKIRLEIARPYEYGGDELEVHISVGIASYPIDGSEPTELQRQSVQALYRAKKEGRSQVFLAYDEKMIPKTVHFTETQLERLNALAEELSITEAKLMREALDDLISKYTVNKIVN